MQPADHSGGVTELVDVLVGYLATHADGYAARLSPDRARAEHYAWKQSATLESMYVRRPAPRQSDAGGPIGGPAMPG